MHRTSNTITYIKLVTCYFYFKQLLLDELSSNHTGAKTIIDGGDFDDNFAQVQIYYEELNFQSISENPNYAVSSMIFTGALFSFLTNLDCQNHRAIGVPDKIRYN